MDYVAQWEYASYLIDMDTLDRKMNKAIQEALILSEGVDVVRRFDALNEGKIVDTIKSVWNTFVKFIKDTFAKAVNAVQSKFGDVQTYLANYKDIILTKPFKLQGVRMKNYQSTRVAAVHVEEFQFDNMKSMENAATYMKKHINTYNGDGTDIAEWTKAYFCNGTQDLQDVNGLNMTDLYNFCMDWENKTKPDLTKDQTAVINSATTIKNLMGQAEQNAKEQEITRQKKAEEEEDKKGTQAVATGADGKEEKGNTQSGQGGKEENQSGEGYLNTLRATPAMKVDQGSFNYSDLYDGIISVSEKVEVPAQKPAGGNGGSSSNVTTNTPAANKFSANVSGLKGGAETQDTANAAYNNGVTYEAVNKAVDIYKDVAGAIASAKLSICQEMFDDYYEVIRAHVKMYIGDDKTENVTAQRGTDYRSIGLPDPNTQKPGTTMKGKDNIFYRVYQGAKGLFWDIVNKGKQ